MPDNCGKFLVSENEEYYKSVSDIASREKITDFCFLFEGFDFNGFLSELKSFFEEKTKEVVNISEFDTGLIKLNSSSDNEYILLYKEKNILRFGFCPANDEKSKFGIKKIFKKDSADEIKKFICDKISEKFFSLNPDAKPFSGNVLTEKVSANNLILAKEALGGNKTLSLLFLKTATGDKAMSVCNETSSAVFVFNEKNELKECKEAEDVKVKKLFFKSKVKINGDIFYSVSDTEYFRFLSEILELKGFDRIRKVGEINLFEENYETAEEIFSYLTEAENSPKNRFYLFLNDFKNPDKEFSEINFGKYISDITNELLQEKDAREFLSNLFENKKLVFKDKILLVYLMSKAVNDEFADEFYPVFDDFRKVFFKEIKNKTDRTIFDIKYSEFLIKAGKKRKAEKILKNILKDLPDETISDLLPPENLDLTSDKSGKLIKVTVLKLLAKIEKNENRPSEIRKRLILQPLNETEIEKSKNSEDENLRNKAETAFNILNGKLFYDDDPVCPVDYKPLPEKLLKEKLSYSSSFKSDFITNLQKWISKTKNDDYSSVKNYSEKINPENHKTLYSVLKNTAEVFGLNDIEFYISKGERNDRITGYEGNPPFVLTGNVFLDEKSEKYLNLCELRFLVASEIAHIYFKHTKLTSADVWRGLADKGIAAADMVLTVIPAAGFFGKFVKNMPSLNMLSKVLQGTAGGISGGKAVYDAAKGFSEFFGKKKKVKKEKEKTLLAVSRLMQYTADKAGLLLCGNLSSAVNAVLLSGCGDEENIKEKIEKISLKSFLTEKDEKGFFKHQNTALRIANLFSFYFSEDYDVLRKKIKR